MVKKFVLLTILGIAAVATSVQATPILLVDNGILTGAKNVDVGGTLYDVNFVDGSCASIYNGCDEITDFDFQNPSDGAAAAQALLDQVFIDGPSGSFDSAPGSIAGCEGLTSSICVTHIPSRILVTNTQHVVSSSSDNSVLESRDQTISRGVDPLEDLSSNRTFNFAQFALSPTGPELFLIPSGSTETINVGDTFNNTDQYTIEGTLTNDGAFINDGGLVEVAAGGLMDGAGSFVQNSGSLVVNGSMDLAQTVSINGGTLSGTGTIVGDVTIGDGAQFLPGNSPGIFNITGNLIVEDGAVLQLELDDEINITGFLDVAPTATVEIILGSATAIPDDFDIAEFFNITNQVASVFEATDIKVFFDGAVDPGTATIDVFGASTQVAVENTSNASEFTVLDSAFSVPEPGTFAILGLGLLGMGAARRRKAA
jgi:hypothetical protein